jgi:hypothetical protein
VLVGPDGGEADDQLAGSAGRAIRFVTTLSAK